MWPDRTLSGHDRNYPADRLGPVCGGLVRRTLWRARSLAAMAAILGNAASGASVVGQEPERISAPEWVYRPEVSFIHAQQVDGSVLGGQDGN